MVPTKAKPADTPLNMEYPAGFSFITTGFNLPVAPQLRNRGHRNAKEQF
jgi:hypothetical protein